MQDTFLDTRAVLEPAGAVSVAGLTQFAARRQAAAPAGGGGGGGASRPMRYVAIGSDAANVEFDLLQRLGERFVSFGPRDEQE